MNLSVISGFSFALIVFVFGIVSSSPNWKIFLNGHAFLIVIGGTIAATLVSFPIKQLIKIYKLVWKKILGHHQAPHLQVIAEVVKLAGGQLSDPDYLQTNVESIQNPFLKEAVSLQLDGGIPDHKIDTILKKRAEIHFIRYEDEAQLFKTISRFPPAFGLLGAVLGMVALLSGLGTPDSFKQIGPSMALSMVATLYGIALANFVFIPLGENLAKLSKEDLLMRNIVIDAVKLLRDKEHPIIVEEYLKSYLLASERSDQSGSGSTSGSASRGKAA